MKTTSQQPYVVIFIVRLESRRSPRTDFAAIRLLKDTNENIRVIFIDISANLRISNKIE